MKHWYVYSLFFNQDLHTNTAFYLSHFHATPMSQNAMHFSGHISEEEETTKHFKNIYNNLHCQILPAVHLSQPWAVGCVNHSLIQAKHII